MREAGGLALTLMFCAGAYAAVVPGDGIEPSVGSRVRITSTAHGGPVIGTLLSIEVNALVLRPAGGDAASRIPVDKIRTLEVSRGRRSQVARGALIGAAAGVMPGLLLTFGDYSSDVHGSSNAGAVAVIGAASGALVGAAVGWALKTENWVTGEVPRAAIAAVPVRGGVALSFRMTWGKGGSQLSQ